MAEKLQGKFRNDYGKLHLHTKVGNPELPEAADRQTVEYGAEFEALVDKQGVPLNPTLRLLLRAKQIAVLLPDAPPPPRPPRGPRHPELR